MNSKDTATVVKPQIEKSWYTALEVEFQSPYFFELKQFLVAEKKVHTIFPPSSMIFNAFDLTPFDRVKVVVLGQDPYHGQGQAHGLCFSVQRGIKIPPSLQNIYKELNSDVGLSPAPHGCLDSWAQQGVLMLNAVLTVRESSPGSHQKRGWEKFTDAAIRALSEKRENIVFILWGNYARAKKVLIDQDKHLILESAHPSPFSANNGFYGTKPFSKANEYLERHAQSPIDWSVV